MDPKTVAKNVRTYRQARGWTQVQLAERAVLCPGTVYRIERGLPTHANTLRRIASALNVHLRTLKTELQTGDRVESSAA